VPWSSLGASSVKKNDSSSLDYYRQSITGMTMSTKSNWLLSSRFQHVSREHLRDDGVD
jgi:hypothetical protein